MLRLKISSIPTQLNTFYLGYTYIKDEIHERKIKNDQNKIQKNIYPTEVKKGKEARKMSMITPYAEQKKRHRCIDV